MARASLLAVVVVTGFFAYITGVTLAFVPVYAAVLVVLLAAIWIWWIERHLEFERSSPSGTHMVGELIQQRLGLANTGWLPVTMAEVEDRSGLPGDHPPVGVSLGPRERISWEEEIRLQMRGRYQLGPTEVRISDPFGLFHRTLAHRAAGSILVYPALHPLPTIGFAGAMPGRESERGGRPRDLPPSASGVREHDPADGINRIHWVSTARQGRLMSRTFDAEEGADLLVVLDLRRGLNVGDGPNSSLEYAVSLAASVAHAGLARGRAVSLFATSRAITSIPAARGEVQEQAILETLALCQADGQLGLDRVLPLHLPAWRTRGNVVVVTSDASGGWVESVAAASQPGQRAVAIFVDSATFGPHPATTRIPPQWRLVLDLWAVKRGDEPGRMEPVLARAAG